MEDIFNLFQKEIKQWFLNKEKTYIINKQNIFFFSKYSLFPNIRFSNNQNQNKFLDDLSKCQETTSISLKKERSCNHSIKGDRTPIEGTTAKIDTTDPETKDQCLLDRQQQTE